MMITAYGDAENQSSAASLGADDFLTKPLDFGLLREKFKEMH
jgi:DNA-binding response OmpR family regulator